MINSNQYNVSDRCYYMDNQAIILKIYHKFNLAKIEINNVFGELVVDIHALSMEPIKEKSVSIKWLGGE